MMGEHEDITDYDDDQSAVCPRCMGDGSVDCNCGGDLCVCENYGYMDCPLCHGEGAISTSLYDRYLEQRRKAHEAFTKVWDQSE
jgi:hypothetical protein